MSSNSMVPAKRKTGKAPTVTDTLQQKVGAPVQVDGTEKRSPKPTPGKPPRS